MTSALLTASRPFRVISPSPQPAPTRVTLPERFPVNSLTISSQTLLWFLTLPVRSHFLPLNIAEIRTSSPSISACAPTGRVQSAFILLKRYLSIPNRSFVTGSDILSRSSTISLSFSLHSTAIIPWQTAGMHSLISSLLMSYSCRSRSSLSSAAAATTMAVY